MMGEYSAKSQEEREAIFEIWLKENYPFWSGEMLENPAERKMSDGKHYYRDLGNRYYGVQIPRRYVNNQEPKWYDSNFDKISKDKDLLEFYNYINDTLRQLSSLLPDDKKKIMGYGVLPAIEKTLIDIWSEKGMLMGAKPIMDAFIKMQTTSDLTTNESSDINPRSKQIA